MNTRPDLPIPTPRHPPRLRRLRAGSGPCLPAARLILIILAAALPCAAQTAPSAVITGAVKDTTGSVIAGAVVTLSSRGSTAARTSMTDASGAFQFSAVSPGSYDISITASGFSPFTDTITAASDNNPPPISAVLNVAPESTKVNVTLPPDELAAQQLKTEEKQRLAGILPNFFVTYEPNAAPLSTKQKFQLGWKSFFDPAPILISGIAAGVQQARNSFPEYGQGAEGFFKRYGANYADRVDDILIGRVVMQAAFHQDPRYFYKSTGSFRSKFFYAIGTAFVRKGDNGHWQFAYSDVLGGMASYELSTFYRPGTSRPWRRLGDTVLLNFAGSASQHLFQQFLLRYITTHVPKTSKLAETDLRAGTAVTLISVDDLGSKTASNTGPIAFTLASDLAVDGVVVAKAGAPASGRVTYSAEPAGNSQDIHIGLEKFHLTAGKTAVPLRGTQVRGAATPLQYHRLENSGRIVVTLYVDADTPVLPAQ